MFTLKRPKAEPCFRLLAFALMLAMLLLSMYSLSRYQPTTLHYVYPVCVLFIGYYVLTAGAWRSAAWPGLLFLVWFVVSRMLNGELYLEKSFESFTVAVAGVGFAYLFPLCVGEARGRYLRAAAWVYALALAGLAVIGTIVAFRGKAIVIPVLNTKVRLTSGRLKTSEMHANILASSLSAGVMLCIWLWRETRHVLPKILLFAMLLAIAVGISLTVCRTAIIITSFDLGLCALLFVKRKQMEKSRLDESPPPCCAQPW